jgi:transcriptional regulator with XRE-family HTH domain
MSTVIAPVGAQLRSWRERRRLSQLELAIEAEISTRHLSFVETGRSKPSRDMVLHLARHLDVPLRYRYQGIELSFVSIVATFGAPLDVTLAELAIEAFYPADAATAAVLRKA